MKKSIFLFFAAILCSVGAWAYDLAANQYVYFEKPADWSNVSLLLGHNSWSQGYNMTKITNTNLYYWKTDSWGGYTRYCFIDATGWGGEGKKPDDRKGYASHSTNVFTNQLIKYHLFTSSGSKSSHASDRKIAINRTQTIKVQLKDGSNWVDATVVPADLTASTYAMTTSSTAVSAASASLLKESTTVSATVDAAYSATVSLSCTNVLDGYMFEGWYNANGDKITSYTVSDAHTVYARFIQSAEETNEVSVTYMCDATEVSPAIAEIVGVETEKSFTAPTVTGYNFTGWTIGAGITLKAGTASDATITVVTKSASSDYTLVANYEEVQETVYFINAGKWSKVYLHLWNGNATGTEWPGSQLTATGEKIGEYDVYSRTAKQGDHLNLLFHENTGDVNKTTDLTWAEGVDKYYIHNYNGNTGWYTQAEAEALLVAPVVYETVYFVNNKNWSLVQIHAWKDAANNGWPGQALTATGEQVAGFDVYSFEAAKGTYTNLLFNNKVGEEGVQSSNYVWTADKYYYMGAAGNYAGGTKEEVAVLVTPDPLATDVYLAGEMTDWDTNKKEFKKATSDATSASVTVNLTAKTYKFKLIIGEGNWRGNTGTMKRGGTSVHEGGWSFEEEGGDDKNCQIVADIAGDYTFTWDLNTKKLTVAYPPLPKYTVTATAENGSVTGAGEYEQGSEATLVATPNTGYAFKNWTKGGEEVSTEATYTFTVTADVELVANFVPEETHEVTISYLCNATPIPGQTTQTLAVGVTTPSTITAPAITNYKFDSWTLGTGVQSEDATTANPIQITTLASGEYTLAANYTKIELTYTVTVPEGTEKCYIAGEMNSWSFQEMTPTANANEFTITIDGATTDHKYKYACGDSWDYVELKADGSGVDDRTYNANDVVAKWAEPAKCYLMGNGDWVNGVEMEYDSENGQYILLCHHISAPFKFKLGDEWSDQVENYDFPGIKWEDQNIVLPEGDYDFYFKKDSKKAYIEVSTPAHTRTVPAGYYATVCLPNNIIKVVGATLFEVAGKDGDKVIFDEVITPVAGMPYIFLAEENTISFYCGIKTAATPGDHKSLHGTFEDMVDADLDGMYMVQNNKIVKCAATGCNIPKNRAYFDGTELNALGVPPAPMPGRRRITMGAEGENTTTGVEGIVVPEGQTIKVISNGQLIIIRNGEMYNAQGQKL